jgi:Conserved TM helix
MLESIRQQTLDVLTTLIAHLPNVLGALLLVLAGWLLARFLRMVITRLIHALNHLLDRQFHGSTLHFFRISSATEKLLGFLTFWTTILLFITVAVRVVGFSAAAAWLDRLVVYLPALVSGGLIVIVAYILGTVARHLVSHASATADIAQAALFGQIAQAAFITIGVVIGLGQVGVDVSFLIILFAIVFGTLLAGFSLAFGLGARPLVENLIAVRHLRQSVRPGQLIVIGADRGRVLEFTTTGLVLETPEGRRIIPAALCMQQSVSVITREQSDEAL